MAETVFDMNEGCDYAEDLFPDAYETPKKKKHCKKEKQTIKELQLPLDLPLQEHEWVRKSE